jgi:uncharacterized protein YoxC
MLEISFLILSIAFLLLAGALAAFLLRVWNAIERLLPIIERLNQALPVIIQNIQDITFNAKQTSSHIHFQAEKLSLLLEQLRPLVAVATIARGLKFKFFSRGTNAAALTKGLSAFIQTLFTQRNTKIR